MLDLLIVMACTSMQDATSTISETAPTATSTTETTVMEPGLWVTTEASTDVRSGPSAKNYPFLRVPAGTPVTITGDAYGFAKVQATGPAFTNAVGWLRITPNATERFSLDAAGTTGTLNGRAEVIAPNLDSADFNDTFRWVCMLDEGATVRVLDVVDLGGGAAAWKIRLPETAEGWIPCEALRQATTEEVVAWSTPSFPETLLGTPTSPLGDWATWSANRKAWVAANTRDAEFADAQRHAFERQAAEEARLAAEAAALAAEQNYVNERLESLEALLAATAIEKLDSRAAQRLVEAYQQVATEEAEAHPDLAHLAAFRANQIQLAADLSADRERISSLQQQVAQGSTDLESEAASLNTITDYVIQGRLAVSVVFNGQDKPIMYRIEDPLSGRSLGYLAPSASLDLSSLLGQRIGVVGSMQFDKDFNVTVVEPDRVDLVSVNP